MGAEADERPHGAAVVVDGFGLKGPRGWAFREVSFRAGPGTLVAIEGPSGSGRTCLLLALTGRMKAKEGTAEVGGLALPRKMTAVRRISALGHVPGVSELDPAFTVAEHLGERALLQRRFDGSVRTFLRRPSERRASARARIDEAVAAAGLDLAALPKGERTSVRDLERLEALRLSIALALIGRPRLLAVDDTDLKLSDADRAEAWALLRSVADSGTTVLAVCSEAPEGALRITTLDAATAVTDTVKAAAGTAPGTEARTDETEAAAAKAEAEVAAASGADKADTADADADADTAAADTKADDAQVSGKADEADEAAKADSDLTEDTTEEGAADALAETGRA
ncbi:MULTISPECIES: ATP-binding cassette domain-containing protein [unclassified Streptomyces]|uniref:ATP-binding cassette domain-containing protein n=1 Tax=unclassified Streptomyces TaxID=2593676 RepID=UPI001E566A65|nr:ATP-binding cassette domain-containing protein [Streptomyces sp. CB02980]MCB8906582.1 ATP-binding cassette domain-containing protein [Streptomyces sp. CB02980]